MSLIEMAVKINVLQECFFIQISGPGNPDTGSSGTAVNIFILKKKLDSLRFQWRIFYGGKVKFKRRMHTHAEEGAFVKFLMLVKDIATVIFDTFLVCRPVYNIVD
jgi:hypothetical protein